MLGLGNDWGRGAENGMSGRKPLQKPHSGGVDNIAAYILALGDKSGECHRRNTVRSSVCCRVGGWLRMAARADWSPESRCLSLQVGMASGGFRVALEL